MGFRIKGRALLCSLIPSFFCVPLSSQLLGSTLPLCFVKPTSIMTLSLPVAAGLILQAGYGGLVYEVDLTHVSKLRKSMGMLCWLVITIQCHYWRPLTMHMIQYFSVFSLFFRDGSSLFTFLFLFITSYVAKSEVWKNQCYVALCSLINISSYPYCSTVPLWHVLLWVRGPCLECLDFSVLAREQILMQGYQLHRA